MAKAGAPWQLEFETVEQRCGYLLTSGQWSDCIFMVGSETKQEVIQAHKLVLAMASPVFEAMFYGGLSERIEPIVPIPDVSPEGFRALLQYIYTGSIDIGSFDLDLALDLLYGAKKYILPHLVNKCISHICSKLGPGNACRVYEFAHLFDEKIIMDNCIQIISTNTKEVLNDSSFEDVELRTVVTVFSLDHLNVASELDLFDAVTRYAKAEQRLHAASKKLKEEEPTIRTAIQKIRFLSLSPTQFAEGPALSDLLTKDDSFALFMNMSSKASPVPMPTGFSERRDGRQRESMEQSFSLDDTINALKCGTPSQVEGAAWAAATILRTTTQIQLALDKGILDALVPALTEGNDTSKLYAVLAIRFMCARARLKSQFNELAISAALEPYCRLLAAGGITCGYVLSGIFDTLRNLDQNKTAFIRKLRDIGVPHLLKTVKEGEDEWNREMAGGLILNYFSMNQ